MGLFFVCFFVHFVCLFSIYSDTIKWSSAEYGTICILLPSFVSNKLHSTTWKKKKKKCSETCKGTYSWALTHCKSGCLKAEGAHVVLRVNWEIIVLPAGGRISMSSLKNQAKSRKRSQQRKCYTLSIFRICVTMPIMGFVVVNSQLDEIPTQ